MDYSAGIRFQTSLVNMDKSKALTKNNQLGKTNQKQERQCQCGSIKHLRIASNYSPVGISYQKAKNWPWGWGYLYLRQITQKKKQKHIKREIVWRKRRPRRMKNQIMGDYQ